jgi:branched-chain amino acid transport system substrate-binding protein
MKHARLSVAGRILAGLAVAALLTGIAGPATAYRSDAHDEPVRIGANIEQSGAASVLGQDYVNALELRAAQINEQGGILKHPVELIFADNQSDPTQAVTQTKRLLDQGVVAIIGPGTSPTTLAAMPTILESGIPVISMGSADEIILPAAERPNVFKTPATGALMARAICEDMKRQSIDRVGLIAVSNPYGDDGVQAWEELAKAGDVDLVATERFEADDVDMTAQLTNLMAAEPQAIVVWLIAPGAPTVRRNAVENLNLTVPMYFDAGAGVAAFLELAGDAANGARIITPKALVWDQIPQGDPQFEALQTFGAAYTEAHGAASGFAGYTWDGLGLLQAAMERPGSTEPAAVAQALVDLEPYAGAAGVFDFTPEDHLGLQTDSLIIVEVKDGRFALAS